MSNFEINQRAAGDMHALRHSLSGLKTRTDFRLVERSGCGLGDKPRTLEDTFRDGYTDGEVVSGVGYLRYKYGPAAFQGGSLTLRTEARKYKEPSETRAIEQSLEELTTLERRRFGISGSLDPVLTIRSQRFQHERKIPTIEQIRSVGLDESGVSVSPLLFAASLNAASDSIDSDLLKQGLTALGIHYDPEDWKMMALCMVQFLQKCYGEAGKHLQVQILPVHEELQANQYSTDFPKSLEELSERESAIQSILKSDRYINLGTSLDQVYADLSYHEPRIFGRDPLFQLSDDRIRRLPHIASLRMVDLRNGREMASFVFRDRVIGSFASSLMLNLQRLPGLEPQMINDELTRFIHIIEEVLPKMQSIS